MSSKMMVGGKDNGQIIVPVENRMYPSDLEETKVGGFRIYLVVILCMFPGGGSTLRQEEMDWEQNTSDQDLYSLPV